MAHEKEDRRITYTKKILREALVELLQEKEISQITITELCKKANVNRGSFYKHYKDIDDLFCQVKENFIQSVIQTIDKLFDNKTMEELYADMLNIISADKKVFGILMSSKDSIDILREMVAPCCQKKAEENKLYVGNAMSDEFGYMFNYTVGGCLAIVRRWLLVGSDADIPTVAGYLAKYAELISSTLSDN